MPPVVSSGELNHERLCQSESDAPAAWHTPFDLRVGRANSRSYGRAAGRPDHRGFRAASDYLAQHGADRGTLYGIAAHFGFTAHALHLRVAHFRDYRISLPVERDRLYSQANLDVVARALAAFERRDLDDGAGACRNHHSVRPHDGVGDLCSEAVANRVGVRA